MVIPFPISGPCGVSGVDVLGHAHDTYAGCNKQKLQKKNRPEPELPAFLCCLPANILIKSAGMISGP